MSISLLFAVWRTCLMSLFPTDGTFFLSPTENTESTEIEDVYLLHYMKAQK